MNVVRVARRKLYDVIFLLKKKKKRFLKKKPSAREKFQVNHWAPPPPGPIDHLQSVSFGMTTNTALI